MFLLVGLTAHGQRFVKTFNTVAEMLAANPNDVHTQANLLGYYAPNDGGGGPVYYDKTSTATETAGTYWKPNSYNGRWIRVIENDRTSSKQWGVFPGSVTPEKVDVLNSAIAWNAANGYETLLDTGDHRPQTNIVLVSNARIVGAPESVWLRDYVLQSRYDKALFSIANAPLPTDPAVTSVPIVATNVSMQNVIVGAVATNKLGPLIAFLGVNYGRIQNCEVRPGAYDWSITWYGNNGIITGNRIKSVYPDSGSTIFTDGVHILGGTNGVVANNSLETGDDNIAFTTFNNVGISHWTVSGNSHKSWRANALRFQQESAYATNLIQHISITGGSGEAGLLRNGTILFYNPSATNNPYPFRNISISHYKLRGGGLDGQPTPIGLSYGIYATGVDGLTLNDVSLGNTPYGNYIFACKDITINNCKMTGGLYSSGFLSPLRVQDSIDLTIMGGRYVPDLSTVASVQVVSVTNSFIGGGIYIEGKSSGQPALLYSLYNGSVKLIGAKVYNSASGGASVVFANDPLNAVIAGNTLSATTPLFWTATGFPPKGSRVHWNEGIPEKETDATTFDVLNTANNGYVGSLNSRANATKLQLQATNGMITLAQDSVDGGTKNVRLGFQPSDASKVDNAFAYSSDNGSAAQLTINGGTGNMNSHQNLYFNIATNSYEGTGMPMMLLTYRGLRLERNVASLASPDSLFQVVATDRGSRPFPSLTTSQANAISVQNPGLFFYDTDETSPAVSTAASTSYYRYLLPRISSDRGDANVTLTSTEAETQIFATTLTANRTVTLPASNVRKGDRFRIVRTGLGSFTLAVGGVKTIPSATAATVDVQHNGTAWQLAGYMEHSPTAGSGVADGDKGDITVSGTGTIWTIDNSAVTYAKMQNVSAVSKLLGRNSSTTGPPEEITLGAGLTMTGSTLSASGGGGGSGDVVGPASATDNAIARFDGTTGKLIQNSAATVADTTGDITAGKYNGVTISGSSTPSIAVTGTTTISGTHSGTSSGNNTGDQTITLTSDVTGSGTGSFATTISSGAVTYSKMQNVSAASKLLGRGSAAGAGSPQEITIGAGLTMSGTTLTASGATVADSDYGDITVSGSGTAWTIDLSAVTYDKIQDMNHTRMLGRKTANGIGAPEEITVSDALDWTAGASPAFGDVLYRGASSWSRLAPGTSGQFLQTQGVGSSPQWATPSIAGSALTGSSLAAGITTSSLTSFGSSPTLVTPTIGVATATSVNKVAITAPATSATLTIANGKTLTVNNTVTLAGTDSTTYTLPDISADIGFRNVPQNSQSAAYTLVLADSGKHIFHPSADANSRTFTIPANGTVAFAVGTTISFYNASANSCTIAITTDTLRKAGTGTTGSVTLPQYAFATIIKVTTTEWVISGNGI